MGLSRCERCHLAFEVIAQDERPCCPQCGSSTLKEPRRVVRERQKTTKFPTLPGLGGLGGRDGGSGER